MVNKRSVATNRIVDRDQLNEFIRPRHHDLRLTRRRDGWPQSSMVTMGLDDASRILVSSYPKRAKVANIGRKPQASIVVMSDEFNSGWVQVDASAEVLSLPNALD